MRRFFSVIVSSLMGVGIAFALALLFPRKTVVLEGENAASVDTPKKDKKTAIADEQKNETLKTNDLQSPSPGQSQASDRSQVSVRGYVIKGGKANVLLTDGRTLTERDGLTRVSRNSVEIEGQTLWLSDSKDKPTPPVAPSLAAPDSRPEIAPTLPPAPPDPESAWEMHADGVSRIKHAETMQTAFSR